MSETLLSVGIDIGTSTTQLILSRLTLANRANPFSVPRIAIEDREVLYRSGIHFTPLLSDTVIDAEGVRTIVAEEYRKSGFAPEQVDTGAVIITGETARKENAREVLSALSQFAGDFVVATAGPDLESILAARGAGADEYSREHHTDVLHFDIGGGTSNLALYSHGELAATGCLDVGGRLIKLDREGTVTYVSPVLKRGAMWASPPTVGQKAAPEGLEPVIRSMVEALEQAAGLRPGRDRLDAFLTQGTRWEPRAVPVVSFILFVLLWTRRGLVPVVVSALMVLPVVWGNVSRGIRETDPRLLEQAGALRFSRLKTVRLVYLPSVRPYFLSAVVTSLGLAWKSGVAAEVLCRPAWAVGTQIVQARDYLETPSLFAWTLVVLLLSLALEKLLSALLNRINRRWSP